MAVSRRARLRTVMECWLSERLSNLARVGSAFLLWAVLLL